MIGTISIKFSVEKEDENLIATIIYLILARGVLNNIS